ncbi:zinc ribbon domain-containing protein [Variovorax terrae]|uniref:Zinc ribbon domain-containing protein n=1 Tax=Variovorax terrae TaxID=2923278 RepID=A0A9X1VY14_9BURK|nr:zinc ribbon domain-containing protein [Variovorax terrae]MCJ0765537.1 zinc ribbon domain-containing protein [Variovorax terrae]
MYTRCPKCGHLPLPEDQAFPAACPACGVILAKVGQPLPARRREQAPQDDADEAESLRGQARALLLHVPERVDGLGWWLRVVLLAGFAVWGGVLIGLDYQDGEIAGAFLHIPLLVFHEAGHVIFRLLGEWMGVLGGSLSQLLMPLILAGALLVKKQDPFGAAIGTWLAGVSLLDLAPYMYDALHPQLMLLSGTTGEQGGHDWIYLFSSLDLLARAQRIGAAVHTLGALVVALSLVWGAWVLRLQRARLAESGA